MFNSSLRRVARSCPNTPSLPSRPSTPTPITTSIASQTHQRRHSSSKPPVPPSNRSSSIPAASVKAVGTKRPIDPKSSESSECPATQDTLEAAPGKETIEKRSGAESRLSNRRAPKAKKDYSNEWLVNMPSVAPTQHLTRSDVHDASFFSIHRPISIGSSLPPHTTQSEFDKLFEPKPKPTRKSRTQDVIYTLSSAVQNLDEHIAQQQRQGPPRPSQPSGAAAQRSDIISALTRHNSHAPSNANLTSNKIYLDGNPQFKGSHHNATVAIAIQEIARRFRPFNSPPAPVPMSDAEVVNEDLQAKELESQIRDQDDEQHTHGKHVILNVYQKPDLRSRSFFTPQIQIESPSQQDGHEVEGFPSSASQTGRIRDGRGRPAMRRPEGEKKTYHMISVRRQRKLKMKKHKYKKLMRKTRNLRRRQDKL